MYVVFFYYKHPFITSTAQNFEKQNFHLTAQYVKTRQKKASYEHTKWATPAVRLHLRQQQRYQMVAVAQVQALFETPEAILLRPILHRVWWVEVVVVVVVVVHQGHHRDDEPPLFSSTTRDVLLANTGMVIHQEGHWQLRMTLI